MATTGASVGKILKRANPGTIQDKFLVGYQGWFTCGNDGPPIGEGHHGWLHWVNEPIPPPFNGRPNTDLWPDTSEYDPSELYEVAGLAHRDGSPAHVFSSRDPRTVRRHFHWMAEHGVDGAFLQRFVGQVDPQEPGNSDERFGGTRRLRDEVGRRVREAAEAEGRVFAIMYDVSGVPASSLGRILAQDFAHLVHSENIFSSPAYLREHGRPVVGVWGLGLSDSPVSPHVARAALAALRSIPTSPADRELYLFAGVPSHWRTPGAGDAAADPAWAALWLGEDGMVDALSPWSVGRFGNAAEVEGWAKDRWGPDAEEVARHNEALEQSGGRGRKVDYVPVVLPGGSGFNLSEGKWAFNGIKRDGGKFLWSQIFHAKRLKGVRSMYGAMWDEYDEGTAFLPVVEKKRLLPESERWPFLALDEDGYDLPADWYMRIAGFAAEGLRSERRIFDSFPSKELQDYWAGRPKYEEEESAHAHAHSSGAGAGSSSATHAPAPANVTAEPEEETEADRRTREARAQFEAWAEEQRRKEAEGEDMPPPAYTLEDDGPGVGAAEVQVQPVQVQQNVAPQVQQQQQQPFSDARPHPQPNYAAHPAPAAVDALAADFARQRIGGGSGSGGVGGGVGVERPPLHPAHPQAGRVGSHDSAVSFSGERPPLHPAHPQAGRVASHDSAGSGHGHGRGSGSGSGGFGGDRPPLHPAHPQAGRVGSHDSVVSAGGSFGGERPPVHPAQSQGRVGTPYDSGGSGHVHAGGRVGTPEVLGQGQGQWNTRPHHQQQQQGPYPPAQHAQHAPHAQHQGGSGGVAGVGTYNAQGQGKGGHPQEQLSGYPAQGGAYPSQGPYPPQKQHTGGSASSAHAPHAHHDQPHDSYRQQQQHTDGSASSVGASAHAPHAQHGQPHDPNRPHQQQHSGSSSPALGGAHYQQSQPYDPQRQHQQHTGGSGSSTSSYPGSYNNQQAPAAGYAPPPGRPPHGHSTSLSPRPTSAAVPASGSGLGHSASLSAQPASSLYPGAASHPQGSSVRPDSAPQPTTSSGYASYPAPGGSGYAATRPTPPSGYASYTAPGGSGYSASPPPPPGHHASLAPPPGSMRPTTPGYAGQAGPPSPVGPHHQSSYSNPVPSHNPNAPPASFPGSSYNPPPHSLPSPDIPGPTFPPGPMASPYGGYHSPPPQGPYPGPSFPGPHQGPYSPPSGPPFSQGGPSFPQGGSDNSYFYQQPQPQFPGAGYSPQHNNYAQQPQGQWASGGGPPPMPHQPGYGQPVSYGGPNFPTAATATPSSGPLGFAATSMDKIVGRRTREQIEGLANSSNKLLHKFL
ncbi:hypothetical protein B0H11DRAFT_1872096 [Mycena galericulata]|nr:hypothetical protein B0H11DRAFT_1872096 [Mycena galericulata]